MSPKDSVLPWVLWHNYGVIDQAVPTTDSPTTHNAAIRPLANRHLGCCKLC